MRAKDVLRRDGTCAIMGVINLSSESFYEGSYCPPSRIADTIRRMMEQGADIVDVGARSTAPNAPHITVREELERIVEAMSALDGDGGVLISVDTQYAEVAERALSLGAHMVNDVSGLTCDSALARVVNDYECPIVLMASCVQRGDGLGLAHSLECARRTLERAERLGVDAESIILDPAIGKWTPQRCALQDLELLDGLEHFKKMGFPLLIGVSRKSFIGEVLGVPPEERLYGSLGATAIAVYKGADIIRTHDVMETLHTVRVVEAIRRGTP